MSWKTAFYADVAKYFNLPEGAEVTDVSEKSEWSGYCSTCWYESFTVVVSYTLEGEPQVESYMGKMAEFMAAVDEYQ